MPSWKKVIVSGSDASLNSLNVTTSLTASGLIYPTVDGEFGVEVLKTDGAGSLEFEIPKTVYEYVKNVSGGFLPKGTPVHSVGTAGFQTEVVAADAGDPAKMPATFILAQDLDDEGEGLGIAIGAIQGINTTGLSAGDPVWVGVGGGWTQTKPTGSALIQNLGIVTRVGTNGGGVVLGAGRSNDVPNLPPNTLWVGNQDWVATPYSASNFYTGSYTGSFIGNLTGTATTASYVEYNNVANKPSLVSGSSQIDHDATTNFVVNEHIDHSTVSITAGDGLTGGGDITTSRTINVGAGTGIDVTADAISVDVSDFMTNGADNRVVTATGTDAMNAEANLTFDGNILAVNTDNLYVSGSRVGIGTTSPTSLLHVYGPGFPLARIERSTTFTNEVRSTFSSVHSTTADMVDGFGSDISFIIQDSSGVSNEIANFGAYRDGADNNGALGFYTRISGGKTENMTIRASGNVGIGTTSPSEKLHVSGSVRVDNALLSNQQNLDVDTGTEVVGQIPTGSYDAAFFDFVVKNGTNLRAGTVYAVHNGTTVEFTETSTNDIGSTTDVTLSVDISGGNLRLLATTLSDNWIIKSLVRGL